MKIIYKLYFSLLPFRISFFVVDLSMGSNMYLFCTKVYLRNKKIYDTIEKKLTITVLNHFPVELSDGVVTEGSIICLFIVLFLTGKSCMVQMAILVHFFMRSFWQDLFLLVVTNILYLPCCLELKLTNVEI